MATRERKVPSGTSALRPIRDDNGRPTALPGPTRPAIEDPPATFPSVATAPAVAPPPLAETVSEPPAGATEREEAPRRQSRTHSSRDSAASEPAPPPPARERITRVQFNTNIRPDVRDRLERFVAQHNTTRQGVIECALEEYMARRGG